MVELVALAGAGRLDVSRRVWRAAGAGGAVGAELGGEQAEERAQGGERAGGDGEALFDVGPDGDVDGGPCGWLVLG